MALSYVLYESSSGILSGITVVCVWFGTVGGGSIAISSDSDGMLISGGSCGIVSLSRCEELGHLGGTPRRKSQAWSYVRKPLQNDPGKKYSVDGSQQNGYACVHEE